MTVGRDWLPYGRQAATSPLPMPNERRRFASPLRSKRSSSYCKRIRKVWTFPPRRSCRGRRASGARFFTESFLDGIWTDPAPYGIGYMFRLDACESLGRLVALPCGPCRTRAVDVGPIGAGRPGPRAQHRHERRYAPVCASVGPRPIQAAVLVMTSPT